MKRRRTVWPAPVAQVIEFHAAIPNALILGLDHAKGAAVSSGSRSPAGMRLALMGQSVKIPIDFLFGIEKL
jgi:hypothetical protein